MTSVGMEKPLKIVIDILFKKLRTDKELLLSTLNECALKDLLVTSPEMISSDFSDSSLVQ